MIQDPPAQRVLGDVSRAVRGLDLSQIDFRVRQPPIVVVGEIIEPPEQDLDAMRAAKKQKQIWAVRALIAAVSFTILIVVSALLIYVIVSNKNNADIVQNLKSNMIDMSADMYRSLSVTNITTNCGNWGSNFLFLNKYSCSGCSGAILNAECSLCTGSNNINTKLTGSSCTGCNMTSSSTAYCGYCASCSMVSTTIVCYSHYLPGSYGNYPQLTLTYNSCSGCSGCVGCSGQYCTLCTDTTNSGKMASTCYGCFITNSGIGYCSYCYTCLF